MSETDDKNSKLKIKKIVRSLLNHDENGTNEKVMRLRGRRAINRDGKFRYSR